MLKITELQKCMYVRQEVMKNGKLIERGNWGFDSYCYNGITVVNKTDNNLGCLIMTEDLTVAMNTNTKVNMFTYYVGTEKELTNLVKRLEQQKFWAKNITLEMV